MIRYFIVSVVSGFVFGILDGLINANPYARELFKAFEPIMRMEVNVQVGVVIDLLYGFAMAGVFLLLYRSLPGNSGWVKGLIYGAIVWFFRVVMYVITLWMIFVVPTQLMFYLLITGLGEMLLLGLLYGLLLRSKL